MSLGMKIKEEMIKEFNTDMDEVMELLYGISKTLHDMEDLIFEEEDPPYILARKKLTKAIENIKHIKFLLGS
jgi:hypothetical protein